MTNHTNNDEYATYIQSIMESVFPKILDDEPTVKCNVQDIDDEYFATVEITGEKVVGEHANYNSVYVHGFQMEELLNKMQDAGFHFNSAKQFTRTDANPKMDLLFVTRE